MLGRGAACCSRLFFGGSKPPPYSPNINHNHTRRAVPWCRRLFFRTVGDAGPYRLNINHNHARRAVPWCRRLLFRVVVGADPYRLVWVTIMPVGVGLFEDDRRTRGVGFAFATKSRRGDHWSPAGVQCTPLRCGAVFAMPVGVGTHDDPHPNQSNKKAPLCKGSCRTNVRLRDCFDCFGLLQSLRHGKPCHLPLHKGGFDFIMPIGAIIGRNKKHPSRVRGVRN